ncbi:BrnA antitoxin family protein [Rhizobium wenxiniae]|uniref:BrnA antitoxin family protein n=1 Tax=Rhizobium wenxiniae TaxID=1737357 RepID=UPI001C6E8D8A|nr:BrnA antitoxin family protein [Rhizobium wenxiniae]MBW9087976.1 BrnA antitoxin family protein [Rhizobium wenxiniae]
MAPKFSMKRRLSDHEEAEIQSSILSDPDNPELTEEQLSQGRPFREALPDLAASIDRARKRGRPPVDNPRQQISVRLDPDIIAHYKATGKGWQSRLNDDLRKAAKL